MNVILLEKIENLGNLGDQVTVKAGYGRNFLLPQGKALPATEANVAEFEARRAELEQRAADAMTRAQARAAEMVELTVQIEANAGPGGKLFGSVGPAEVAKALTDAGVSVEKAEVRMPEGPIRAIGEVVVGVHLHSDVDVDVTVNVVEAEAE
jgi:large subunit ribosomal protein L9